VILPARPHHSLGSHEDENKICASCSEQRQQSWTRSADSFPTRRACRIRPADLGIDLCGSTGEPPLAHNRYSRFVFSGMDDLHCKRADFDAGQQMDYSSLSPRTVRLSGTAHLHVPDDHLHFCDVDHFLSELIYHGAVMLSEAKHLCSSCESQSATDQRLKAWPRGLRPLRCSFASLRMTCNRSG
jgi:hypothetical protein